MRCSICGNESNNTHYSFKERMFGLNEDFDYFQCAHCSCLQIARIPEDMSKYYPTGYYSFNSEFGALSRIKKILFKARTRYAVEKKGIFGRYLYNRFPNEILEMINNVKLYKTNRILDVGCGNGSFIYMLRDINFQDVLGIDPFIAKDIVYDNGSEVKKKSIHEQTGEWDVIIFHHSFEHVPDPRATFQSVYRLLSKDGICLISVPTVSSWAWENYKEYWVQLDAPRHFFLHSKESMKILAAQFGMNVTKAIYNSSTFQFWGSEQYLKGRSLLDENSYAVNPSRSMFSVKDIKTFQEKAKQLDKEQKGDTCIFILKKQQCL